jgi:hypothetical protein
MEFVDFPPSLFPPSLYTKLLLPVSPLCLPVGLPAQWGKILNIFQMMVQVILDLREFYLSKSKQIRPVA